MRLGLIWRLLGALIFTVAGGLLFLLSLASREGSELDRIYPYLLAANLFLVLLMGVLAAAVVARAWRRYRQRVFGSRLMVRLALAFAVMGIVPVLLVSAVSVQYLAKTIDSWFSDSVGVALESGARMGRNALQAIQTEAQTNARRMAAALEEIPREQMQVVLDNITEGANNLHIVVYDGEGSLLAVRGGKKNDPLAGPISSEAMAQLSTSQPFVLIETPPGRPSWALQVRALAATGTASRHRIVQWTVPVPDGLAENIDSLNQGYQDYRQLALGKQGIRRIYGVTLTLAVLLAAFVALSAAVMLSSWLASPLRALERATRAVAEGDYQQIRESLADHELNDLVRSFNEMTHQLSEARSLANESLARREAASRFLEQVLTSLSAGVMVFSQDWRLVQSNPGVARILGPQGAPAIGTVLDDISGFESLRSPLEESLRRDGQDQRQLEYLTPEGQTMVLLLSTTRLSSLNLTEESQYVMVFDDISALMSAERTRAWADIARRLAHEIKNPLTPIQLSAERLAMRLTPKLDGADQEMLNKGCHTIVEQVGALKNMVDEFRNYARLPMAVRQVTDLSALIREIMPLYGADPRVQAFLAADCWALLDHGQLRQVVHNLVQNAQDAMGDTQGQIRIQTQVRQTDQGPMVVLSVEDEGPGLDPELKGRLFEPYVTSKSKGSGLGLAIVHKIVEEHQATVSLRTRRGPDQEALGSRAEVVFAQQPVPNENRAHG